MINKLKNVFPDLVEDGCYKLISEKHTFIFENEKAFFVKKQPFHLHIENKTNQDIHFLQNDNCIMKNNDGKQCDYVIFNASNIYFTEVKVTKNNLSNHRKEAIKQLENTIKFYSKLYDLKNFEQLKAVICFKNLKRIAPQASTSSKQKEVKQKYNVNLEIGNYILFE